MLGSTKELQQRKLIRNTYLSYKFDQDDNDVDNKFICSLNELLELQKARGRTIIFVSHDLDEAFKIGNRIAIMEGGRIVQCGTPREIFTDPANEYVADFVAHMNPLGVLTARDVMTDGSSSGPQIDVETPVQAIMDQIDGAALQVIENGAPIGIVTQGSLLSRLAPPAP